MVLFWSWNNCCNKVIKKGKEAQAVSSMFTGLTLAILLLVPF